MDFIIGIGLAALSLLLLGFLVIIHKVEGSFSSKFGALFITYPFLLLSSFYSLCHLGSISCDDINSWGSILWFVALMALFHLSLWLFPTPEWLDLLIENIIDEAAPLHKPY